MTNATHNFGGPKAHISLPIMLLVAIEPNIATKYVMLWKQVVLKGSNPCSVDMEGDLGIPLILGRPFLRDVNARIDVGAGKVSLRIMGKTMKFEFQNKRELFLIHEDSEKQGLWAEPGWENWDIHHSPSEPAWEDWEIHDPPTKSVEDDLMISDFITNTVQEDLEIVYPTPEDPTPAPSTPPKKTKKVWRKKKKGSAFWNLNQEIAWRRSPPLN